MSSHAPLSKAAQKGKQKFADVSVVSLDEIKPSLKLSPGEPHNLAPGVTISVLQSAAEALLEIDAEAAASTHVNDLPTSELATVQTGQIIKTSAGRFVMIRHLESLIIPRDASWKRPDEMQQAVSMALATCQTSEAIADGAGHSHGDKVTAPPSRKAVHLGLSRKNVIRGLIVVSSILFAGLFFYDSSKETDVAIKTVPEKPVENARSRIIAVPQPEAGQIESNLGESVSKSDPQPSVALVPIKSTPPATTPPKQTTSLESLQAVGQLPSDKGSAKPERKPSNEVAARSIKLTEKDRQTIMEYKLEARFDRSNARAKLKHLAESFPKGSPARMEVEKAYSGL